MWLKYNLIEFIIELVNVWPAIMAQLTDELAILEQDGKP